MNNNKPQVGDLFRYTLRTNEDYYYIGLIVDIEYSDNKNIKMYFIIIQSTYSPWCHRTFSGWWSFEHTLLV
jgi:hypothetical protein